MSVSIPPGACCPVAGCGRSHRYTTHSNEFPSVLLGCGQAICNGCADTALVAEPAACPVCFEAEPCVLEDSGAALGEYIEEEYFARDAAGPCVECSRITGGHAVQASVKCSCGCGALCSLHGGIHSRLGHSLSIIHPFTGLVDVCEEHGGEKMTAFCATCGVDVCLHCCILDHPRGPEHDVIRRADAIVKYSDALQPVKTDVTSGSAAMLSGRVRCASAVMSLQTTQASATSSIITSRDRLIALVTQRADELIAEVNTAAARHTATLSRQITAIDRSLQQLDVAVSMIDKAMKSGSPLCMAKTLHTAQIIQRLVRLDISPAAPASVVFTSDVSESAAVAAIAAWGNVSCKSNC